MYSVKYDRFIRLIVGFNSTEGGRIGHPLSQHAVFCYYTYSASDRMSLQESSEYSRLAGQSLIGKLLTSCPGTGFERLRRPFDRRWVIYSS